MRHPFFSFTLSRFLILAIWLAILGGLFALYYFWPHVFYQGMQTYQKTPYVNTP